MKKLLTLFLLALLCVAFSINAMAIDPIVDDPIVDDSSSNVSSVDNSIVNDTIDDTISVSPRLVDNADLLSASEEKSLLSKLDEISERQNIDVVIVTVKSLGGKTLTRYAEDFYDDNGYGFGSKKDGILLLIDMEDREWDVLENGYADVIFTNAGVDYISEKFLTDLSDGNYHKAFEIYAEQCDAFITQARNNEPYDSHNLPKADFEFGSSLIISLIIGFVVAFIATSIMKGQLKSVALQTNATNYVRNGSMKVTEANDFFLYRTVDRRARPKQSSSSNSHSSSSGRSHTSGKF